MSLFKEKIHPSLDRPAVPRFTTTGAAAADIAVADKLHNDNTVTAEPTASVRQRTV